MEFVLYHLVTVAVAAVVIVLLLGLWNLTRGNNSSRSQTLMRWRVGLQAVAIVIIMLFVFAHYR
jgi:Hypoxia induced protein conserved region